MNRKPPELHLIDGTKSRRDNDFVMPEEVKKRIPKAYWLDNPESFNKEKFIEETSEFLYTVYGIGNDQDQHTLAVLAEQIDLYIKCSKAINQFGVITTFNNGATVGPNPNIPIRNNAIKIIIQLMNELGLTPRSRLSAGKTEDNSPVAKFLKGPLAH